MYIELPKNVPTKLIQCVIQAGHVEVGIRGHPPYLNVRDLLSLSLSPLLFSLSYSSLSSSPFSLSNSLLYSNNNLSLLYFLLSISIPTQNLHFFSTSSYFSISLRTSFNSSPSEHFSLPWHYFSPFPFQLSLHLTPSSLSFFIHISLYFSFHS